MKAATDSEKAALSEIQRIKEENAGFLTQLKSEYADYLNSIAIARSSDGINWEMRRISTVTDYGIAGLFFGNGLFLAFSTTAIYTSFDGWEWQKHDYTSVGLPSDICANNDGTFTAISGLNAANLCFKKGHRDGETHLFSEHKIYGNGEIISLQTPDAKLDLMGKAQVVFSENFDAKGDNDGLSVNGEKLLARVNANGRSFTGNGTEQSQLNLRLNQSSSNRLKLTSQGYMVDADDFITDVVADNISIVGNGTIQNPLRTITNIIADNETIIGSGTIQSPLSNQISPKPTNIIRKTSQGLLAEAVTDVAVDGISVRGNGTIDEPLNIPVNPSGSNLLKMTPSGFMVSGATGGGSMLSANTKIIDRIAILNVNTEVLRVNIGIENQVNCFVNLLIKLSVDSTELLQGRTVDLISKYNRVDVIINLNGNLLYQSMGNVIDSSGMISIPNLLAETDEGENNIVVYLRSQSGSNLYATSGYLNIWGFKSGGGGAIVNETVDILHHIKISTVAFKYGLSVLPCDVNPVKFNRTLQLNPMKIKWITVEIIG